jgi:formate hydrogenlyase subunit 6/NADH:ubiquinone oxidoreductase subunit I
MPAQVVVVKRSRRRAFAIVRSVPAWLRALLAAVRTAGRPRPSLDLTTFDAFRGSKILAPERQSGITTPRLTEAADLTGCPSCSRCVAICPSAALALGRGDAAIPMPEGVSAIRFDLDPGRCIGCGECVRVCPSRILEMAVDDSRVGEGARPVPRSLLGDRALKEGVPADVH